MLNEQIPQVGTVPPDSIKRAVAEASDAFWAKVVEHFPEVTTGDFGPGETAAWEQATNAAVVAWLTNNHPSYAEQEYECENVVRVVCLNCGHTTTDKGSIDLWNGYGDCPRCDSEVQRTSWLMDDGSVTTINAENHVDIPPGELNPAEGN